MEKKKKTPGIIIIASVIGLAMSVFGLTASGWIALLLLTIIPFILCLLLLIKKYWICGLLYCIVFLLARSDMFLGQMTALATMISLFIVAIFVWATIAAYRFKRYSS